MTDHEKNLLDRQTGCSGGARWKATPGATAWQSTTLMSISHSPPTVQSLVIPAYPRTHVPAFYTCRSQDWVKHVRVRAEPPLLRAMVVVEQCHIIFLHPEVNVSKSVGGFSMETVVLYLSHAMLVLAELIICLTRGYAFIVDQWFDLL